MTAGALARRRARDFLKGIYMAVPFKLQLFSLTKAIYQPPQHVFRYLNFRGKFKVDVDRQSFYIRNDWGLDIETSVFWTGLLGSWERVSLSIWIELCRTADVVFDIGANTGIYSLVAKAVNPRAQVYAFEPIRRIYEKLVRNNELNGFDIRCLEMALSSYDGEGVMYDLPYRHVYAVMLDENLHSTPAVETKVAVARGSTFIRHENLAKVDLIKLDVESHEPKVLEGFGECIRQTRPTILVEIWNDTIGEKVQGLLDGNGYLYFSTDEHTPLVRRDFIRNSGPGYLNYLACTEETARALRLV